MTPWERVERIGECTLYLGDCRRVMPFVEGVRSIVTDPPYGQGFRSNYRKVKHAEIAGDDATHMLTWACIQEAPHSAYIWMRWDNLAGLPRRPTSLVTWVKPNHSMGDLNHEHGRQTEVCAFYRGPEHAFPSGRPNDVIRSAQTNNDHHPTEKPVGLMSALVGWTDGLVCDPFMGSGTTGVACAKAGRPFVEIEINPQYFEVAVARIRAAAAAPDMFGSAA